MLSVKKKSPCSIKTSECEHRMTLECLVSYFAFLLPAGVGRGGYYIGTDFVRNGQVIS